MQEPQSTNQPKITTLKDRVLSAIDNECVTPKPRYLFLCLASLVWLSWGISVFVGGVALAVLFFVSTHRYYDMYEASHDNFITFFLSVLPFVWVILLIGMLALAVRQLRSTTRGYRWSVAMLGGSSVLLSVGLGALFYSGGFGWWLDDWLGAHAPMYMSQAERERELWQQPAAGRLIGSLADTDDDMIFEDVVGNRWVLDSTGLRPQDYDRLSSGVEVRMLGMIATSSDGVFYPCGVFPAMHTMATSMNIAADNRIEFVDRMYWYHTITSQGTSSQTQAAARKDPCEQLAAVRRMNPRASE